MNLKLSHITGLILLAIFLPYCSNAQSNDITIIRNSSFPDSWDSNRDLRGRNGEILMWRHVKRGSSYEQKDCILLVSGPDSTGNTEYFILEKYSNEKPFTKWNYAFIHYADYFKDSITGFTFGFHDSHIEKYYHKPTQDELYSLLKKWRYSFFQDGSQTIEAGLNEELWLKSFGFKPDKEKLLRLN